MILPNNACSHCLCLHIPSLAQLRLSGTLLVCCPDQRFPIDVFLCSYNWRSNGYPIPGVCVFLKYDGRCASAWQSAHRLSDARLPACAAHDAACPSYSLSGPPTARQARTRAPLARVRCLERLPGPAGPRRTLRPAGQRHGLPRHLAVLLRGWRVWTECWTLCRQPRVPGRVLGVRGRPLHGGVGVGAGAAHRPPLQLPFLRHGLPPTRMSVFLRL